MDVIAKRRGAERVRRLLGTKLRPLGFVRGKTSFWARPQGHVIEFLHLHLFTFTPAFRAHAGIRVVNDTSAAAALNGPTSDGSWSGELGGVTPSDLPTLSSPKNRVRPRSPDSARKLQNLGSSATGNLRCSSQPTQY